jgi:hypothetical protein
MKDVSHYQRFEHLTYDHFRQMATDSTLSAYEKIGFPDEYREGKESLIFEDICAKLPRLQSKGATILDIGPGCSELPRLLIELCRKNHHSLLLVDSAEMLEHLPNEHFIQKFPAYYPDCPELLKAYCGRVDVLLIYSVFHYAFTEGNPWAFLDLSLSLLAEGGQMLIGDIPNISKRNRFFASPAGVRFHQEFTGTSEIPEVDFNRLEPGQIDDSVIFSLLNRARNRGCDAYVLPQNENLSMANRREDVLICKP